jgi:hypothetical protein
MLYELELEIGPQSETRIRNFISGGPAFAAMPLFVLLGDPQPKSGVAFLTGCAKSAGNGHFPSIQNDSGLSQGRRRTGGAHSVRQSAHALE